MLIPEKAMSIVMTSITKQNNDFHIPRNNKEEFRGIWKSLFCFGQWRRHLEKILYDNLKFYIYLPLKNFLRTP